LVGPLDLERRDLIERHPLGRADQRVGVDPRDRELEPAAVRGDDLYRLAGTDLRLSTPALADLYATTSFETAYTAYKPSGSLAWQFRLQIYTPTAAGTYPIAIVVGGSGACQDVCSSGYGTYATIVAQDAAKRGMVAAAVHYKPRPCPGPGAGRHLRR
jgi:hypothetical protein